MKLSRSFFQLTILFVLFFLSSPEPAYAYLDPGGFSYFLQIALAGLVGAIFAFKNLLFRVRTFLVNLFSKNNASK